MDNHQKAISHFGAPGAKGITKMPSSVVINAKRDSASVLSQQKVVAPKENEYVKATNQLLKSVGDTKVKDMG